VGSRFSFGDIKSKFFSNTNLLVSWVLIARALREEGRAELTALADELEHLVDMEVPGMVGIEFDKTLKSDLSKERFMVCVDRTRNLIGEFDDTINAGWLNAVWPGGRGGGFHKDYSKALVLDALDELERVCRQSLVLKSD
jgi:hypothetical protein